MSLFTQSLTASLQFQFASGQSLEVLSPQSIFTKMTLKQLSAGQTVVSIVQTPKLSSATSATSATYTITKTPTPGNILIAFLNFSGATPTIYPASGWTILDPIKSASNRGIITYFHTVQPGDGTSWTWTFSAAVTSTACIYEISGATVNNFNQHSNKALSSGSAATTWTTDALTPSVLNCLPIAVFANPNQNVSSIQAGWTADVAAGGSDVTSAQHGPLTTDTITAITGQVTWVASAYGAMSLILLSPATYAAAASSLSFSGAIKKMTQKLQAAALSFVGAVVGVKNAGTTNLKSLTGGLSFSGAFATAKIKVWALTGAVGFIGNFVKQTQRPQTATLSPTANMFKQVNKAFTAGLTSSGIRTIAYAYARSSFAAGLTFVGATTKQTQKNVSGGLSFVGKVVKKTLRNFSAVFAPTGSLTNNHAQSIVFSTASVTMKYLDVTAVTVNVSGGNAPYTALTSNPLVATAYMWNNGLIITPRGPGSCKMTVTDSSNNTASLPITVYT